MSINRHHRKKILRCSVLPTLFAANALVLSSIAAFDCKFVKFVVPPATESHEQAGLWNYSWWDRNVEKYTCHAYPPSTDVGGIEIDAYWRAARGFSSLTLIFGGLIVFVNISLWAYSCSCRRYCCNTSQSSSSIRLRYCTTSTIYTNGQVGGTLYLIPVICSSLSLLFLKCNACQLNTIFNLMQDHTCMLSTGAKCTYVAMALWFVAALLAMVNEEREVNGVSDGGDGIDCDERTEPLIQDVVLECEQSVYSGRDGDESIGV